MVVHSNMANATSDHSLYFWCEIISAPNEPKYAVADRTILSNMGHSCCIISGINDFLAVVERVSSVMVLMSPTLNYTEIILYSTGYSRFLQNSPPISNIQGASYTYAWLI